ncbi:MAG: VWA domain-containing protein, partial [Deltaproteobacteria bacterium]|nr:VWA domain-containing protein [Deltaproteobacteria bacterium]
QPENETSDETDHRPEEDNGGSDRQPAADDRPQNPDEPEQGSSPPDDTTPTTEENSPRDEEPGTTEQVFAVGTPFKVKKISSSRDRTVRRGSGRRSRSRVSQKQGRYSRAGQQGVPGDIALDASIRAAAPFQQQRSGELAIKLCPQDLRFKIREKRLGNLLLFIVDASGSMGARGRMAASKGAVMSLLLDAYQKRDKVAMISFRRDQAFVNLPVTNSVELAGKLLSEMPVGGRTPLSAGLVKGYEQVRNYLAREPAGRPIVIILTDGKGNVSLGAEKPVEEMLRLAKTMGRTEPARYVVVDTEEEGLVTFGLAGRLATALGADYFRIRDLQAEELVSIAQEQQ